MFSNESSEMQELTLMFAFGVELWIKKNLESFKLSNLLYLKCTEDYLTYDWNDVEEFSIHMFLHHVFVRNQNHIWHLPAFDL